MNYKIITDSCCDLTAELKRKFQTISVPLKLRLGEKEFVDNDNLNLPSFMEKMKACVEHVGSAAPSPHDFLRAFEEAGRSFVVTLSSQLSGSHASALVAETYTQDRDDIDVHIFDSKSASAGQTLLTIKIHELIQKNFSKDVIVERINNFIDEMKTYFVLERYDNLQRNGRLGKVTGTIIKFLGIRLVMGSDRNGDIALYHKARGEKQMLERMLSLIANSGKKTDNEIMVISHCNNMTLAQRLSDMIKDRFNFNEIYIVPTGGLSSLYADDQGIIMAF